MSSFLFQVLLYSSSELDRLVQSGCPICGKKVASRETLRNHINIHQKVYRYRCEFCGKGFSSTGMLRGHMAKHTGVKEYCCWICHKEYPYKHVLKRHMMNIHKEVVVEHHQRDEHTKWRWNGEWNVWPKCHICACIYIIWVVNLSVHTDLGGCLSRSAW